MKKKILPVHVLFSMFLLLLSLDAGAANVSSKIILSPDSYIIRSPGYNVTFSGQAQFGTPCFNPPYYNYNWYLNGTLIGATSQFTRSGMDFGPGNYTLTLEAIDCMGRSAREDRVLYIVNPLIAKINTIDTGGSSIFETNCSLRSCGNDASSCHPNGMMGAADDYDNGRIYIYNRTLSPAGEMLYLTYDDSMTYEIDDPGAEVIFPNKCLTNLYPYGFFTLVQDKGAGDYYFLVSEDDFIGGLGTPICNNVCKAFMEDFIPIVSKIVMCDVTTVSPPERISAGGKEYTKIDAVNSGTGIVIHFIFADDMGNFLDGRWNYKPMQVESGLLSFTIPSLCLRSIPTNYDTNKCLLTFEGTASGGLPPYDVKWVSSGDGVIDTYKIALDGGTYEFRATPPMAPPLSQGLHDITFYVEDQLGLKANDVWKDAKIPWCCAINTPCTKYWPGRQGPEINTGCELSFSCDIIEVCHPDLWDKAREALYCCKNNCPPECHNYCKDSYKESVDLGVVDGVLSADALKKCSGLYLIYGFGPVRKYMTDYFFPEICCANMDYCLGHGDEGCCDYDMGTCTCAWHAYSREATSLPCQDYVSTSSKGWASDIAMNRNTCMFADLPAHASMNILNTGTCVDYSTSLTTMLRIVGYGPDEVLSALGPSHAYNLVRFPASPKWNIIDTVGNLEVPYARYGIAGIQGYPYCSYSVCYNDAGMATCPATGEVWGC